jgi:hypothetical protein
MRSVYSRIEGGIGPYLAKWPYLLVTCLFTFDGQTKGSTMKGTFLLALGVAAALIATGCGRHKQIPLGNWMGTGRYVDCQSFLEEGKSIGVPTRPRTGAYETSLTIRDEKVHGHDALLFEIRSRRGRVADLQDEQTHIFLLLVESQTHPDGVRVYTVADWNYGRDEPPHVPPESLAHRLQIASAVATRVGRMLVLQLYYTFPDKHHHGTFLDTFVFQGRRVKKMGRLIELRQPENENDPDQFTTLYWVEQLRKVRKLKW